MFFKKRKPSPQANKAEQSTKLVEVELPSDSLEIGMHVTRLDRPWTEVPVLLQGLTIESQDDLDVLRDYCDFVYIEIEHAFWIESGLSAGKSNKPSIDKATFPGFREEVDIRKELPRAQFTIDQTLAHVDVVLENVSNGETFDLDESRKVVRACVTSIMSNANAMLWLTKIKRQDHYTAEHSMRVGILAIAFGRFLGLEDSELETLGLCGMLHDVGKMRVPTDILNKPGRLTRIEYEIMKQHAELGKDVLDELQDVDQVIKDTAHLHHERIDGMGYPMAIDASQLHKFIRMISIVDVYDAITSARPYKDGAPAFDALKILFSEVDRHFDKALVEAFIRMVGIYPPGTLVEMTNGEVGIVVSANPNSRLRPKVELIMDADKKYRGSYVIDLSQEAKDSDGAVYSIKEGLANGTYGVDVTKYILK